MWLTEAHEPCGNYAAWTGESRSTHGDDEIMNRKQRRAAAAIGSRHVTPARLRAKVLGTGTTSGPSGLDAEMRNRVADAVEATLADAYPDAPLFRCCWDRAAVTHRVLSAITSDTWHLQAGSFQVRFADDVPEDLPNNVGWDFEMGFAEGKGFGECHAWVARAIAGGTDVEIVDSSSRHLPAFAATLGHVWTNPVLPVVWDSASRLWAKHYVFRAHPAAVAHFHTNILPQLENLDKLAYVALQRTLGRRVRLINVNS